MLRPRPLPPRTSNSHSQLQMAAARCSRHRLSSPFNLPPQARICSASSLFRPRSAHCLPLLPPCLRCALLRRPSRASSHKHLLRTRLNLLTRTTMMSIRLRRPRHLQQGVEIGVVVTGTSEFLDCKCLQKIHGSFCFVLFGFILIRSALYCLVCVALRCFSLTCFVLFSSTLVRPALL